MEVSAAQASDKMVLPGSDGLFRSVASVHVGQDQLVFNLVGLVVGFHGIGGFVVETMDLWMETATL